MSDNFSLASAFFAGALLGVFFFGGLWWTVQKAVTSDWPAVWFLGSLLVRTGVILVGFFLVSQGHWIKLVVCFCGFLMTRFAIVTRFTQAVADDRTRVEMEARSAP
jgi:F1F0 ATPase subunit 2